MPGSRTPVTVVLAYNVHTDKAKWMVLSELSRLINADFYWIQIYEDEESYAAIAAMAGHKPEVLIEEVVQLKQGDTSGKKKQDP